jgi:hypothetical protein
MSLVPAWLQVLSREALEGLASGKGPYWSGRFLGGQPLFGAPELPFGAPSAPLLFPWNASLWLLVHTCLLSGGLSLLLSRKVPALNKGSAALLALLLCFSLLAAPESAALIGVWAWVPWTLLLLEDPAGSWADGLVAAPFCAFLACSGSLATLGIGLGAGAYLSRVSRAWRLAWGAGLALAAPALLETLRLAPDAASVTQAGWHFAALGGPLLVFQCSLALLLAFLVVGGPFASKAGLALGLGAGMLAMAGPLFDGGAKGFQSRPAGPYLAGAQRRQVPPGQMPRDPDALAAERWSGGAGGLAPSEALQRWRALDSDGVRRPDLLTLADVGWLDQTDSTGLRWHQAVPAAVVEGGVGDDVPPRAAGVSVLDAPLRVDGGKQAPPRGQAWHVVLPKRPAPGDFEVALPATGGAAWLFLSENFDRGWNLLLKGDAGVREQRLLRSEAGFLAAPIDLGDATAVLEYRPPTLGWGLALALAGLAFLGACALFMQAA